MASGEDALVGCATTCGTSTPRLFLRKRRCSYCPVSSARCRSVLGAISAVIK